MMPAARPQHPFLMARAGATLGLGGVSLAGVGLMTVGGPLIAVGFVIAQVFCALIATLFWSKLTKASARRRYLPQFILPVITIVIIEAGTGAAVFKDMDDVRRTPTGVTTAEASYGRENLPILSTRGTAGDLLSHSPARDFARETQRSFSKKSFQERAFTPNAQSKASALPTASNAPAPSVSIPEVTPYPAPSAQQVVAPPSADTVSPNLGRRLSSAQQAELILALKPLSASVNVSRVYYDQFIDETFPYAKQFAQVFDMAGLKPVLAQDQPQYPDEVGVMLEVEQGTGMPLDTTDKVKLAFEHAGLHVRIIKRSQRGFPAPILLFIGPQP